MEKLIPLFVSDGLRVAVIKHAHHSFDLDTPGKDSWRHRQAGACEVLIASAQRWVLMHELKGAPEPSFEEQLAQLSPCDLVLVEGFKAANFPKMEVHRQAANKPWLYPHDPSIVALASDLPAPSVERPIPTILLNDTAAIGRYILSYCGLIR